MQIERQSVLTGVTRTREIPITEDQLTSWLDGTPIQRAAPNLSADDREFILSGITPEEWDTLLGNEEAA